MTVGEEGNGLEDEKPGLIMCVCTGKCPGFAFRFSQARIRNHKVASSESATYFAVKRVAEGFGVFDAVGAVFLAIVRCKIQSA